MADFAKKHAPKFVVVALLVLNLVLITMLVVKQRSESVAVTPGTSGGTAGTSSVGSPSPTPKSSQTASTGQEPEATAAPLKSSGRVLAANSDSTAWRAVMGSCAGRARVEVTTDGGKSWRSTDSGLSSIVRLKAFGHSSVFAVGADRTCRPTYAWISGPDGGWQEDSSAVGDTWYRVPGNLDRIHAPESGSTKPCGSSGLVDLAGLGTYRAAVLCGDGSIRTHDAGRGWKAVEKHSTALALNADDATFVAAVTRSGCDGVVLKKFGPSGDGLGPEEGKCEPFPGGESAKLAVSNTPSSTWVWSGDQAQPVG